MSEEIKKELAQRGIVSSRFSDEELERIYKILKEVYLGKNKEPIDYAGG